MRTPTLDPDLDGFRSVWARALREAAGEPLVVHCCGHGEIARGGASLRPAVRGSERGALLWATTIDVDELPKAVQNGPVGPVLFLPDVCGGGQALAVRFAQRPSGHRRKA
ncbi:hypothetical protein [Embleya sp. NPDC050493]|uniref:hypothetical protein n=1 Tax=Embleya sp. NPDC050493 TaxID=3363989 RepID=UPI0037AC2C3A